VKFGPVKPYTVNNLKNMEICQPIYILVYFPPGTTPIHTLVFAAQKMIKNNAIEVMDTRKLDGVSTQGVTGLGIVFRARTIRELVDTIVGLFLKRHNDLIRNLRWFGSLCVGHHLAAQRDHGHACGRD